MRYVSKCLAGVALLACLTNSAIAADLEVHMLNKGADGIMVFEPVLTKVNPGDTVTFIPTDKSHNAETVKDMLPDGAEAFKGKVNEQIKVTFTVPGAYVIKCNPHYAMGMAAVIVVGDPQVNLEKVKTAKYPKKAGERVLGALASL
ncbi:pseudoazurin [Agrobacterium vitis]|uniref:pseudoazurin n=1 Tax=Rhizobium/Agrobacterium group TaxID=227290 RepID=UPI000871B7EE|nr:MULTISPECIES: pseudoazurin [Rhizobium/Agrobacterium group]MCF1449303.1 pseudoazurin [Allorhizobium ampelinum]MCF1464179.1 pseudoazurin [Allorhizobium ampelinum]MCF1484852.1 pseudoazurin [Allorhizobium ampelinum]MUO71980.1 pseudoazurin [Agrobacterium vitis]